MTEDVKQKMKQCDDVRRVAFFGVTLSTIATLVCVISVPMIYSYMQQMHSSMLNEVDFCKSRSGNIWREVTRTQVLAKVNPRRARQTGYGGESLAVEAPHPHGGIGGGGGGGCCCGCGVSSPGLPGPPGQDGAPVVGSSAIILIYFYSITSGLVTNRRSPSACEEYKRTFNIDPVGINPALLK
ncbi:hypothetical protein QR680_015780 [Steinernema hermaphroditum]|uniref:Nematode cuticle collagen N-terminal domain-containing protein n=1 Tax=Steinernema hermaphroditum TaxID=289476 RepID=A0AA39LLB9_9BILA|nr:hypothetical protein QR680_015780 [Steinernema hermaphroditum]